MWKRSFEELPHWLGEISEEIPVKILVANKIDNWEDREVSDTQAMVSFH